MEGSEVMGEEGHRDEAVGGFGRASVCFRIGVPTWLNAARFEELLELFDRNAGVTDEITLFTSETHPPLPLEVIVERAAILKERMAAARERGYRSGINVLATIGHHEENLPNSLTGDYTFMTDKDGRVCRGTFCPNDANLRAYIAQVYEAVAKAEPDYIWLDDDIRLWGHKPIKGGCFCETCIRLFSERVGRVLSRASLVEALSSGTMPEKLGLRRAFLQHNRETVGGLFRLIEGVVHGVSPGMPLGFMTGDRFFEGYDFDGWADVLAGPEGSPVLWRPGGGTYTDERLVDIVNKGHDVGRQVALLPPEVRCIQSEVESFPYQRLKKSVHATALEAAVYIASGCTGAAFNVLTQYDEPFDEYEPLVAGLREARPFLDRLVGALGRAPLEGIHSGWVKDTYAANQAGGAWFGPPSAPGHCNETWATGLPAAYGAGGACVTALSGDQVLALSEAEIRAALAGGVYLDAPAVVRLHELGYGELIGFEVAEVREADCIEELVDHPLNGGFCGRRRNGRQSFWECPTYLFRPVCDGAEVLARCVDYTYQESGACCAGVYENDEGGRVHVAGYYPWEQLQNLSGSARLKAVMRWLSRDGLPAYVASFHRVNLWVRRPRAGAAVVALLNASLDPARGVELRVRCEGRALCLTNMRCEQVWLEAAGGDGPYQRFSLPELPPWALSLAVVE